MQTERLYFADSYQQSSSATIIAVEQIDDSAAVVLDRTCFYPTSGGQAHDVGTIGNFAVTDVQVDENGVIHHLIAVPPTERTTLPALVGHTVEMAITWPRRYDHMQQHSGQHLLSQVFYQQFGFETVAVHIGSTESTLDLATSELTPTQVAIAETVANELIYQTLPIHAYTVAQADLAALPLRKAPQVHGTIRIVEIDQFDYSACGGTHCRTTGELGPLKIIKRERQRSKIRVTFLCGHRALRDYQTKHDQLSEAARLFSNQPDAVPGLIERSLNEAKAAERTIATLQQQILQYESATLLQQATRHGNILLLEATLNDREINRAKELTLLVQQQPDIVALLALVKADKATFYFGCAANQTDLHMGQLLRATLAPFGGRGGGRADFAQGGGVGAEQAQQVLQAARQALLAEDGGKAKE